MKHRMLRMRITGQMIVLVMMRATDKPACGDRRYQDSLRAATIRQHCVSPCLNEVEMPDFNSDGRSMVNGIDLNGRPYGGAEEWGDHPWDTDTS